MTTFGSCYLSRSTRNSAQFIAKNWDGILASRSGGMARKVSTLSLPSGDYRHKKFNFNSALLTKRRSFVPMIGIGKICKGGSTRTTTKNSTTGVASSIRQKIGQLKLSNPEPRKLRRLLSSDSDDNDQSMTVTTSLEADSKTSDEEDMSFPTFYRQAHIGLENIALPPHGEMSPTRKNSAPPWNWDRRLSTEVWPDVSIIPVVASGKKCCAHDHSSSSFELMDRSFRFRVNTRDRTSSWINEQAGRKRGK